MATSSLKGRGHGHVVAAGRTTVVELFKVGPVELDVIVDRYESMIPRSGMSPCLKAGSYGTKALSVVWVGPLGVIQLYALPKSSPCTEARPTELPSTVSS